MGNDLVPPKRNFDQQLSHPGYTAHQSIIVMTGPRLWCIRGLAKRIELPALSPGNVEANLLEAPSSLVASGFGSDVHLNGDYIKRFHRPPLLG